MLSQHTALITGASRGIGQATAVALARAGVRNLLLHYGSHRAGAEETLEKIRAAGADGLIMGADLATEAGLASLLEQVAPHAENIEILVNNAGSLFRRARLAEFTPAIYESVMNLNVRSVWFLTQCVAAGMVAARRGVIVNVSSIAARNGGGPGATIYAAAKAAVSAMTKGLSKELAPHGVRVNAISPGTVENHFHETFSTREILEGVLRATPQGRLSTNEDMADVVVFLASDAARNIHGQTIEINGGALMV